MGELLQSRGYLTRNGSVRRTALEELVLTYSRGRFEHPELNHLLTTRSRLHAALADLYSTRATLHPALATVVCAALRNEPEVEQQLLLPSPREMQTRLLRDALMSGLKPSAAAVQAGASVTTAVQMAFSLGLIVLTRPKKLREHVASQVVRLLGNGRRPAQVAKAVGVSLPSVYRIMARTEGLKRQLADAAHAERLETAQRRWLALMAANPGMGVKELRAKQSAVYAWLYRHAHDWLMGAGAPTGAAKRVAPAARHRVPEGADQAFVERLATARDIDAMDMPRKLTRTALAQQCGRQVGHPRKSSKVTPLSEAALANLAERDEAYVLRRVSAATAHLHNAGESIATWRVIKASRVRASFIERSGISAEEAIARTRALAREALCAA
jgi:transposase